MVEIAIRARPDLLGPVSYLVPRQAFGPEICSFYWRSFVPCLTTNIKPRGMSNNYNNNNNRIQLDAYLLVHKFKLVADSKEHGRHLNLSLAHSLILLIVLVLLWSS